MGDNGYVAVLALFLVFLYDLYNNCSVTLYFLCNCSQTRV